MSKSIAIILLFIAQDMVIGQLCLCKLSTVFTSSEVRYVGLLHLHHLAYRTGHCDCQLLSSALLVLALKIFATHEFYVAFLFT